MAQSLVNLGFFPLQQKPYQLEVCICNFQTTNRGTLIFHKTKQKQKAKQNVTSIQAIETANELFGHKNVDFM